METEQPGNLPGFLCATDHTAQGVCDGYDARVNRAQRQRIRRIKNRIKRTEARLAACQEISRDEPRRVTLLGIVSGCANSAVDFENLVDDVADRLDALIEPSNPIAEWLSDVGIDIAAFAAVTVWRGARQRLENRLARDRATLERLVS